MVSKGSYLSWIVVSNIEEGRKFFSEVLGLKERAYDPQYKWAEFSGEGGTIVGICEYSEHSDIQAGSNAVMTFTVDDLTKAKKELIAKGAKMIGDVLEVPGHVKMQSFCDQDGNYFQIVEALEEKL